MFIGIDPGISGGIAVLRDDGTLARVHPMPATEADVLAALMWCRYFDDGYTERNEPCRAVLERVSASPQMGVVSAFTFGKGYGALKMALTAAGIPFDEVTPGTWQQVMGVRQKTGKTTLGRTHVKDKNISKRRAQQLFPELMITHAFADALLIADFCRRTHARTVDERETVVAHGSR